MIKVCNEYKIEKPANTKYFPKRTNIKSGLGGRCKECVAESYKEYRMKNKEKLAAKDKAWYEKNREYKRAYKRRYQVTHAHVLKAYNEKNKEKIRADQREWETKDRLENPDRYTLKKTIRRTRLKGLKATLTLKQWLEIKKEFDYECCYCGISEEEHVKTQGQKLHREHFIALSKQGELTHNNIIPSCRSCNSSKGESDFFEWYPSCEHYSEVREKKILDFLEYEDEEIQQLALFI